MEELKRKFGGVTVYERSPAEGKTITSSDDIVIFEIMREGLERAGGLHRLAFRVSSNVFPQVAAVHFQEPGGRFDEAIRRPEGLANGFEVRPRRLVYNLTLVRHRN